MKFRTVKINSATKVFDFEASSLVEAMGIAPKVAHFGRRRNCQTTNCNMLYLYTISPDGRYLLVTLGAFGQFHIWHNSADLYVKDLHTGELRALKNANSPVQDSYHTWSSNGRWIVFGSRRDDGNYTRPYIDYFDKNGIPYDAEAFKETDHDELHAQVHGE